jgi:mannose-binding lectin 2
MWITKQRAQTGTVFGFIDRFEGLGVLIDTYKNGRSGTTFPYVMAMLGDGQTAYDVDMDGKANEVGGCSVNALPPWSIRFWFVMWSLTVRHVGYGRLRSRQRAS